MTRYIDVNDLKRLVAETGIESFVLGLVDYIESDYRRWAQFQKSPRMANHSQDGVIELMPASDGRLYGFKYVNGHPKNTARQLPTVMAFGVLAEVDTGYPLLLSELTLATALRTAATSVLAARALARPGIRTMAVIGNGAQSEFQILAFRALLGVNVVRLFDTDPAATARLVRNLAAVPGLTLVPAASTADAVRGADIVTTVTADKTLATILTPDMIEPGMHLNAVGGDCPGKTELHPDILVRARVVVEFEPQTRIEGDIQQMPADFPVTELWEVLSGKTAGRDSTEQVTVFDSVGFALEDFATLRYLYDLAREKGAGTETGLVPALSDPKDLYGFIYPAAAEQA